MCHHHEYAQMILAGGLIVILGLYMKYASEIKLIESGLHALLWHKKKMLVGVKSYGVKPYISRGRVYDFTPRP